MARRRRTQPSNRMPTRTAAYRAGTQPVAAPAGAVRRTGRPRRPAPPTSSVCVPATSAHAPTPCSPSFSPCTRTYLRPATILIVVPTAVSCSSARYYSLDIVDCACVPLYIIILYNITNNTHLKRKARHVCRTENKQADTQQASQWSRHQHKRVRHVKTRSPLPGQGRGGARAGHRPGQLRMTSLERAGCRRGRLQYSVSSSPGPT